MIEAILQDRQKTHGSFTEQSHISQTLKDVCRPYACKLTKQQREALEMILHKVARILAGNPNEIDHWKDIAGYATLIVRELDANNPL